MLTWCSGNCRLSKSKTNLVLCMFIRCVEFWSPMSARAARICDVGVDEDAWQMRPCCGRLQRGASYAREKVSNRGRASVWRPGSAPTSRTSPLLDRGSDSGGRRRGRPRSVRRTRPVMISGKRSFIDGATPSPRTHRCKPTAGCGHEHLRRHAHGQHRRFALTGRPLR